MLGTAKLVKTPIKSKITYNVRGIAFDGKGSLSFGNDYAKDIVNFGVKNSS